MYLITWIDAKDFDPDDFNAHGNGAPNDTMPK
jgi:hypothetical protein